MNRKDWNKIDSYSKKLKAIDILGGGCENCGEKDIFKLCFHHENNIYKEYEINKLKGYRWSLIEKEIKKCKLLCQNCHHELHFDNEVNDQRRRNMKKFYLEYKDMNKCQICGYTKCIASLDLHHVNKDKDFKFSKFCVNFNNVYELYDVIKKELDKCTVICKNCHCDIHSDKTFLNENMNKILEKKNNMREIQPKIDRNLVIELYKDGMKQIEISKKLNCSKSTISLIIKVLATPVT